MDCRNSELEYIKNSILNSKLNNIFELSQIDWLKCEEFALSNRVKEVCDYWHLHNDINNEGLCVKDLSTIFSLDEMTIRRYLKKGVKFNWCNYNPDNEKNKGYEKSAYLKSRKVEILKNGYSLGIFKSCRELERESKRLFGVQLFYPSISNVANGKQKHHKGYTFRYI